MSQPPETAAGRSDDQPDDEPVEGSAPSARLSDLLSADLDAALAFAEELHPAELADALEGLTDDDRERLLVAIDPSTAGDALYYVEPHFRGEILRGLEPDAMAAAINAVADDVATDIVQELGDLVAEQVLAKLPIERRRAIERLLTHPEDTAGGRMTGQLVAVRPHYTADQTLATIRNMRPDATQPFYLYVTDARRRLLGVVNLRALIAAPVDTPIDQLMLADPITVRVDTDQEDVARLLKQYKLLALPVVDSAEHLLGTVTSDDVLDVLEDEATEDMFRIVGVNEEEDLRNVRRSVRYRLPWLLVNLLTALLAGFVVSLFSDTLAKVVVLTAFLPVIAGQGGNAGIQTVTVMVRSIALGRVAPGQTMRLVVHELLTGLIVGAVTGLLVGLVAYAWQGNTWLGLLVGFSMTANVIIGAFFGTVIPLGLQGLKQDPALSSGIWLTTTTDVLGFLVYLGAGALLVSRLT